MALDFTPRWALEKLSMFHNEMALAEILRRRWQIITLVEKTRLVAPTQSLTITPINFKVSGGHYLDLYMTGL
jgi:hypothetical protein